MTRNQLHAIRVYIRNKIKCFWFLKPTQLLIHGQCWSMFIMHFLPVLQCWTRGPFSRLQTPQGIPWADKCDDRSETVPGSISIAHMWLDIERNTMHKNIQTTIIGLVSS